jgi:hypothetical protein
MTTAYTTLLGLALPVQGELTGTWGTEVNNSITQLLDDAIAGTATASVTSGDWTLTDTGSGVPNQARCAILIATGTPGVSRNIIAPARSKGYFVVNQSDAAVVLKGASTTGISVPTNKSALVVWNGSDFVTAVSPSSNGTVTTVSVASANGFTGSVSNPTSTPAITLATSISGVLKGNGTAISAATSGTDYSAGTSALATGILKSTTSTGALTIAVAGDFPTLNQNTTGTAAGLSTTLSIASGGTNSTATPTAGGAGYGTGTAHAYTAAGTAGQVLTSNGAGAPTWTTLTSSGGTVTSVAALTLGTTGTDVSSSVANSTTTPVITLNIPTASATNRGVLSSTDWTAFNNKGSGTVTSVSGTAPVVSSGGATPAISMAAATTSVNGYLTSTDWTTFNGKYSTGGALGTPSSGTLSSCTVDGTNGVGYINIPQNSQSAAYTLVAADAGKHIFHPSTDANARTFTIPANGSVAYPIGTAISFVNMTSQVVSIAITSDTMYLAGTGTTGTRSLAQYGTATALKMTSTTWIISGAGLT